MPAELEAPTQQQQEQRQAQRQRAVLFDFSDSGLVPYEQGLAWQRARVDLLCAAQDAARNLADGGGDNSGGGTAPSPTAASIDARGALILLQHPPTYTLGAGATVDHLRFDASAPPHPLHRVERGGEVTYHGPGQLVLYPILDLSRHTRDLHWYLRSLEEVALRALEEVSGLQVRGMYCVVVFVCCFWWGVGCICPLINRLMHHIQHDQPTKNQTKPKNS
jgi:hypothetical protein